MKINPKFLQVAKKAALEAGKVILQYYGGNHRIEVKGEESSNFVTKADLETERTILEILKGNFQSHNFIAEESGIADNGSEYTWLIDPIDGTISFVAGIPHFAVSIALLKNNQPIIGVVNRVAVNELYWAEKGSGTFLNGEKVHVSHTDNLASAVVAFELGYSKRKEYILGNLIPLADKVRYPYVFGGTVSTTATVAKGILDAYMYDRAKPWDFAAVAVLVEEAGGKVSLSSGQPIDWTAEWIDALASNGLIHDQIVEALKQ